MRGKSLLYFALILLTLPMLLFAQQVNTVSIYGTVTDSASGQVLQGILVEAINEADTSRRASDITDQNGHYSINLPLPLAQSGQSPSEFHLKQNYPNPFNPSTLISFQLPLSTDVQLVIYNTLGQKIRTLIDQQLSADSYTIRWDATNDAGVGVAAGVYFYRLKTDHQGGANQENGAVRRRYGSAYR